MFSMYIMSNPYSKSVLKIISIPSTLNSVDNVYMYMGNPGSVFYYCAAVTQIILSNGLTFLSYQMFYRNNITTLVIPSTITYMGDLICLL